MEASQAHNMSVEDVANYLIDNRIPPEWVDHTYVFDLRFLKVHYSGAVIHQGLLEPVTTSDWLDYGPMEPLPRSLPGMDGNTPLKQR